MESHGHELHRPIVDLVPRQSTVPTAPTVWCMEPLTDRDNKAKE